MKRNSLLKGVVLSTILSALLTGCGSSSAGSPTTDNASGASQQSTAQTTISGKAVDGYLQYATVCLDLSSDGYCQAVEPNTLTDENGSFTLQITEAHRADANFDTAALLVYGGKDIDTGKDFRGKLSAANDGSMTLNISPITTLVAKHLEHSIGDQKLTKAQIKEKLKAAKAKVAEALEIGEDEIGLDPVAYQHQKSDDKLIKQALKVQKSIEALMFAAGVDESEREAKIEAVYEALALGLNDLGGEKGVEKLFEKAAQKEQFRGVLQNQNEQAIKAVTEAITQNLDEAFENYERKSGQLEKIAAILEDTFVEIEKNKDGNISGAIFLGSDPRFGENFDWEKKYIEQDLKALDIEPTDALIEKLKTFFAGKIKAGVLFHDGALLKDNADEALKAIYTKIEALKTAAEIKKEAQKEQHDSAVAVDLLSLMKGKTFYEVEKIITCEVGAMPFLEKKCETSYELNEIQINEDATTATVDGEVSALKIEGRTIIVSEEGKKMALVFKAESEKTIEFYQAYSRILTLYKNKEDAEANLSSQPTLAEGA